MPYAMHSSDGPSLLRATDSSALAQGASRPHDVPLWQEGSRGQVMSREQRDCHQCATARAVAKDARDKQLTAEEEVARARESERRAYAVAQEAFDQVAAARREIDRTYLLLGLRTPSSRGSA